MKPKTLASEFEAMNAAREPRLDHVRKMALLACPSVAPEENRTSNDELENPWQNMGTSGMENLTGRSLLSLFPPGIAWYRFRPSALMRSDPGISPEVYAAVAGLLSAREIVTLDKLESTNYRLAKRTALEDLLVAGASLCHFNDDYKLRRFRYDQWVAKRGSDGSLLWYVIQEKKDVAELTKSQREIAGVKEEDAEAEDQARIRDLYTKVNWEPDTKRWHIRQELNKNLLAESDEIVCPYIPAGYRETSGENYPRSFLDNRIAGLRSYNTLKKYELDIAENMAFILPVADTGKGWQPSDWLKRSGVPTAGRVTGNKVDGLALLETEKQRDLAGVHQVAEDLKTELGRAMLMLTEAMPTGDRVTAQAVRGVARELEGALGGVYSHIAEQLQRPFLERLIFQMERDNLLPVIPAELRDMQAVEITTGIAALSRQQDLDNLITAIQILSPMPGVLETLNLSVVADRVFASLMVDRKGLVLTPAQINANLQAQAQQQITSDAAQQAIKTIGTLVEQRAQAA